VTVVMHWFPVLSLLDAVLKESTVRWLLRWFRRTKQHSSRAEGTGRFRIAVRGESRYQDALRAIAGSGEQPVRKYVRARLVPEPSNRYDHNSIQVRIQGHLVGYLSREDARAYAPAFARRENRPINCAAVIVGGGPTRDGRRKAFGVWLALPPPEKIRTTYSPRYSKE